MTAEPGWLPDWLGRRAWTTPERLALVAGEGEGCAQVRWTFAELDVRASQAARRLASLGIGPGSRVATLLRNSQHVPLLVHGVGRLDAVLVPLNIRLTADEVAWQLADVGASLLVFDQHTAALAGAVRQRLPALPAVCVDGRLPEVTRLDDVEEADVALTEGHASSDVHSIVYTSGTTGRPKGAMLTYGNHWWSAIGSALNLGNQPDDRWLACLPLFHVGGMAILLRAAIYGITAVVHEAFDAGRVNRAIDEERVTIVSVVATMLQRMLAERGETPYPAWFRCALLGGGPAPRPLLEACAARGVPVVQTYGLTETASQVATLAPEDALPRLGSAGKPLYPNELRVAEDGVTLPVGEPGEILVRGPVVAAGYFGRPGESASALRDGWLHTGDFGTLDSDGSLYVLDRRSDLIVSGGENVYPAEVEAVLLAHPAVEEAGVIGVPHPEWGQTVAAVVRPVEGAALDADELCAFCRERLGRYKVPTAIRFASALPRNAAGKLLRRELRERWLRELGSDDVSGGHG
jgi:O-succinylbenzoic acid--CoA ligase